MGLMTINEAADYLRVHPDTLRIWENEGHIKATKTPGGHRRFSELELQYFLSTEAGYRNLSNARSKQNLQDVQNRAMRELDSIYLDNEISKNAIERKPIEPILSPSERLNLQNQHKILAKLYPEEADYHNHCADVYNNGYELYYKLENNKFPMHKSHCLEVLKILDMFISLNESYNALDDKKGISEDDIRFQGFMSSGESDSNGNSYCVAKRYADFAKFYYDNHIKIANSCGYSHDLSQLEIEVFESSKPVLSNYRRMLIRFDSLESARWPSRNLTKDEIMFVCGLIDAEAIQQSINPSFRHKI